MLLYVRQNLIQLPIAYAGSVIVIIIKYAAATDDHYKTDGQLEGVL